jgi:hypothetical protein
MIQTKPRSRLLHDCKLNPGLTVDLTAANSPTLELAPETRRFPSSTGLKTNDIQIQRVPMYPGDAVACTRGGRATIHDDEDSRKNYRNPGTHMSSVRPG